MYRTIRNVLCLTCLATAAGVAPAQTTEVVLYNFTGGSDGGTPTSGVIADSAGNLYGTTYSGGAVGWGVVYKIAARRPTVLYSFTGGNDGGRPSGGVIRDSAGNLYGTTPVGGTGHEGAVYRVDSSGNETVLYNFTGGTDGGSPSSGVIRDSAGNLYGTTEIGGALSGCVYGCGVVYRVDSSGNEKVLYPFTGGADGNYPYDGVIGDSSGNLYGATYNGGTSDSGVVYKVSHTGHQTVLYTFLGGADGLFPSSSVIRDSAGNLYGTTSYGGAYGNGAVYKVDSSGNQTVVYSFTGGLDGGLPYAGVIRDSAGNLYGTADTGGGNNQGAVYKVDSAGNQTVLYSFKGSDGAFPQAGLIRDSAGNLYGTTTSGGKHNAGVVFKLTP
jgi:uncharacterized repeat protein (TIGR03803 family)